MSKNEDLPSVPVNLVTQSEARRKHPKELAQAAIKIATLTMLKERAEQEAYTAKYTDADTGLLNRKAFYEKLPGLISIAKANNEPLAIMLFDIDGLKRTNTSEGYMTGDVLIKSAAEAVNRLVRTKDDEEQKDIVGRYGGDEFWVVLPGYRPLKGQELSDLNKARIVRVEQQFAQSVREVGIPEELHVGISAGIAVLDPSSIPEDATPDEVLRSLFSIAEGDLKANKGAKGLPSDERMQA